VNKNEENEYRSALHTDFRYDYGRNGPGKGGKDNKTARE
jgi:hypothetical protein